MYYIHFEYYTAHVRVLPINKIGNPCRICLQNIVQARTVLVNSAEVTSKRIQVNYVTMQKASEIE